MIEDSPESFEADLTLADVRMAVEAGGARSGMGADTGAAEAAGDK